MECMWRSQLVDFLKGGSLPLLPSSSFLAISSVLSLERPPGDLHLRMLREGFEDQGPCDVPALLSHPPREVGLPAVGQPGFVAEPLGAGPCVCPSVS